MMVTEGKRKKKNWLRPGMRMAHAIPMIHARIVDTLLLPVSRKWRREIGHSRHVHVIGVRHRGAHFWVGGVVLPAFKVVVLEVGVVEFIIIVSGVLGKVSVACSMPPCKNTHVSLLSL